MTWQQSPNSTDDI